MDDLATWLRAVLDRREQVALAASPGPWAANAERDEVLAVDGITVADGFALSGSQLRATVDHIVLNDPPSVLAEVDAKRQRLEWIMGELADDPTNETAQWLAKLEAAPYANQPGYREEWKP